MALEFMSPGEMTDTGMYVWAVILAVVVLVGSYFVAGWWQRWRERKRENERA